MFGFRGVNSKRLLKSQRRETFAGDFQHPVKLSSGKIDAFMLDRQDASTDREQLYQEFFRLNGIVRSVSACVFARAGENPVFNGKFV